MEVRVLGPIEVRTDIGVLSLGGPQQRRILAVLVASRGQVLSIDRLIPVLWPDGDEPNNARHSAITYVSRLRLAIGANRVSTTTAGYSFDVDGVSIDADQFVGLVQQARSAPSARAIDLLDEALALWRGPAFGDLGGEWWARAAASKLDELRVEALVARIEALTSVGWDGHALADARSLVHTYSLREQCVDLLMRGLHALGQTAEAMREFQRYRLDLAEQTGMVPSAALLALERSLATGEDGSSVPSRSRPLRGYVLRERIGEGAFGAVYRATQPGVERDVAVKVVRPDLADDRSFVQRFEVEARLVARLEHPNIVPLYDFWREPGGAFLVFRLMRGGNASELLQQQGGLSLQRVGAIAEQVGSALATAHLAGFVHRDVKPANVLFDDDGVAYLADFGIAAAAGKQSREERAWSAQDARYASPERLRNGIEDVRADQYALAVMLWELLTGTSPFPGDDSPSLVAMKLSTALAPVHVHRGDIPVALTTVLTRASSVHPGDRYETVGDFVEAWQRAASSTAAPLPVVPVRHITNPYKGLRAFDESDAAAFHGRDEMIECLSARVAERRFVTVVGPSGSGKSSLVLAGLVPRLRADHLIAVMTPGVDPFAALAGALGAIARAEHAEIVTPHSLRALDGLTAAAAALTGDDDDQLLIVIDQMEELWSLVADDRRRVFLSELARPVSAGMIRVVATVRADSFDRPLGDPTIGSLSADGMFGVTPMTAAELHDVIAAPAEIAGVMVQPMLISKLVAESADQPGSLPLLQFALAELFDHRELAVMTLDSYAALGGLANALGDQAEHAYQTLGDVERSAARRLFLRLVSPSPHGDHSRHQIVRSQLAGVPDEVIETFVRHRLLTVDRDRSSREPTVEVAHEALLGAWSRLRRWLDDDRSWLDELRELSEASRRWETAGCDNADLYRGTRLAVVADLASDHADMLTAIEAQFLAQSVDHEARQQRDAQQRLAETLTHNRRLRRSLIAVAIALVIATVAGSVAVVQRRDAADSRTGAQLVTLASQSLASRSSQRDLAALLAVEAWRRTPDAASRSALFGTFTFDPGFLGYVDAEGDPIAGVAVPGTSTMLTADAQDESASVSVVDVGSGRRSLLLTPPISAARIADLAVSSNGQRAALLAIPETGPARAVVYDLSTGHAVGPTVDVDAGSRRIALDTSGMQMAIASGFTGDVVVHSTRTGGQVANVAGLGNAPPSVTGRDGGAVAFAPDGRLFVGSATTSLRVFDARTFQLDDVIDVPQGAGSGRLWFSIDGVTLVAGGIRDQQNADGGLTQQGSIARINLTTNRVVWELSGDDYGYGECATFAVSADADRLWCGNYFGVIRQRALATGQLDGRTFVNQKGGISGLDIVDLDGASVLVSLGNNSGALGRWRIDGTGPIQRIVADHRALLSYASHETLLTAAERGVPYDHGYGLWDITDDADRGQLTDFLFASSTQQTVYGLLVDKRFGTVDTSTSERHDFAVVRPDDLTTVLVNRDGAIALLGYLDGRTMLVDVASGRTLAELRTSRAAGEFESGVDQLAITADDTRVYVAGHGLWAFDVVSGREIAHNDDASIDSVAVSSSGVVAATSVDGGLMFLNPDTLRPVATVSGARGFIEQLRFSADGALLLAAANDGSVSIYDVVSRIRLGDALELGGNTGVQVDLRGDGLEAAVARRSGLGTVLWDLDPRRWAVAACAIAGRNLTRQEWQTYLGDLGPYRPTCAQFPAQ